MKKTISRLASLLCAAAMMLCTGCSKETTDETADVQNTTTAEAVTEAAVTEGNNLTSLEVIGLMGNGINLGNTLEAYNHQGYLGGADPTNFETSWGQPKTTPEIIPTAPTSFDISITVSTAVSIFPPSLRQNKKGTPIP